MYKEIVQVKSFQEIKNFFLNNSYENYFTSQEIESIEDKNIKKSLGARLLIKESILHFLNLSKEYKDIEIKAEDTGKPFVGVKGIIKDKLNKTGISNIQISMSHSRNYVSTLVVVE